MTDSWQLDHSVLQSYNCNTLRSDPTAPLYSLCEGQTSFLPLGMSSSNHIGSDANILNNMNSAFSSTKTHNESSAAGSGIRLDTPHGHLIQFPVAAPYQQALFSELPPYGHTFPQPFNPLPSSTHQGILPTPNSSEPRLPTFIASKYQTESDPAFPSMGPSRSMSYTLDTASEPEGATIDVATEFPPSPGPTSMTQTPPQSSRRNKNYTLADGTIVSGKGLGRGRPGSSVAPEIQSTLWLKTPRNTMSLLHTMQDQWPPTKLSRPRRGVLALVPPNSTRTFLPPARSRSTRVSRP